MANGPEVPFDEEIELKGSAKQQQAQAKKAAAAAEAEAKRASTGNANVKPKPTAEGRIQQGVRGVGQFFREPVRTTGRVIGGAGRTVAGLFGQGGLGLAEGLAGLTPEERATRKASRAERAAEKRAAKAAGRKPTGTRFFGGAAGDVVEEIEPRGTVQEQQTQARRAAANRERIQRLKDVAGRVRKVAAPGLRVARGVGTGLAAERLLQEGIESGAIGGADTPEGEDIRAAGRDELARAAGLDVTQPRPFSEGVEAQRARIRAAEEQGLDFGSFAGISGQDLPADPVINADAAAAGAATARGLARRAAFLDDVPEEDVRTAAEAFRARDLPPTPPQITREPPAARGVRTPLEPTAGALGPQGQALGLEPGRGLTPGGAPQAQFEVDPETGERSRLFTNADARAAQFGIDPASRRGTASLEENIGVAERLAAKGRAEREPGLRAQIASEQAQARGGAGGGEGFNERLIRRLSGGGLGSAFATLALGGNIARREAADRTRAAGLRETQVKESAGVQKERIKAATKLKELDQQAGTQRFEQTQALQQGATEAAEAGRLPEYDANMSALAINEGNQAAIDYTSSRLSAELSKLGEANKGFIDGVIDWLRGDVRTEPGVSSEFQIQIDTDGRINAFDKTGKLQEIGKLSDLPRDLQSFVESRSRFLTAEGGIAKDVGEDLPGRLLQQGVRTGL